MLNTAANSADPSQNSDVSLWSMPGCPWPFQCQGIMVGVAHINIRAKLCTLKEMAALMQTGNAVLPSLIPQTMPRLCQGLC